MKKITGGRCLPILVFMLLGGLLVVFGATVLFPQLEAGQPKENVSSTGQDSTGPGTSAPVSTLPSTDNTTADSTLPGLGVTLDVPLSASGQPAPAATLASSGLAAVTATLASIFTASPTPGALGLGTPSFPLTLTMQHGQDQTRVASRLAAIQATQTDISRQSQVIFATLTAAAAARQVAP